MSRPRRNRTRSIRRSAPRRRSAAHGSPAPPKTILNAPTRLMKREGYGADYRYDHDAPDAFCGQNYWPEKIGRRKLYEPVERGFEREMSKRLEYWARLRAERGGGRDVPPALQIKFGCRLRAEGQPIASLGVTGLEVDQTMLMDMSHMNQRSHFYRHVVHQVLMLDVADVSSPSHVAPSVPATFDINRRTRRNDGLDLMMRAGSRSQVQVRGGMGYGCASRQGGEDQTHD